jgi:hypothetical protein
VQHVEIIVLAAIAMAMLLAVPACFTAAIALIGPLKNTMASSKAHIVIASATPSEGTQELG